MCHSAFTTGAKVRWATIASTASSICIPSAGQWRHSFNSRDSSTAASPSSFQSYASPFSSVAWAGCPIGWSAWTKNGKNAAKSKRRCAGKSPANRLEERRVGKEGIYQCDWSSDVCSSDLECGVGWVPYWMERMDEEWEKRGKVEAPLCRKKPSEYVKYGNPFFALEPGEETGPYVIERIGADKILFASDYPHWDGIFPHVVSTIRGRKDISDEAKAQILGQNAKRFYGWH